MKQQVFMFCIYFQSFSAQSQLKNAPLLRMRGKIKIGFFHQQQSFSLDFINMLQWINTNFSLSPPPEKQSYSPPQSLKKQDVQLLPNNLSGRILELQFLCQGQQVSKDMIAILIEQYTKAIEYYQQIDSSKFMIYKKRMQNFLKKTKVDDILRGKSIRLITIRDNAQKQIHHALNKSKQEVKKLLNQSETKADRNHDIVFQNIELQQKQLSNRIERRRSKSNHSSKSAERSLEEQFNVKKQNRETPLDLASPIQYYSKDSKTRRVFI